MLLVISKLEDIKWGFDGSESKMFLVIMRRVYRYNQVTKGDKVTIFNSVSLYGGNF